MADEDRSRAQLMRDVELHARRSHTVTRPEDTLLRGCGEGILLVEDDDGVREVVAKTLLGEGYLVFRAASATEALGVFAKERGTDPAGPQRRAPDGFCRSWIGLPAPLPEQCPPDPDDQWLQRGQIAMARDAREGVPLHTEALCLCGAAPSCQGGHWSGIGRRRR